MNVLLAYRCPDTLTDQQAFETLPAGLPWVAASLRDAGHAVTLVNFSRLPWRDVERYVARSEAEVVGISWTPAARRPAARLLRVVRKARPDAVTVVGGAINTPLGRELLARMPELDLVVRGEGELPIREACHALANRRGLREAARVPGVVGRGSQLAVAPAATPPDPQALPIPSPDVAAAGVEPVRDLRHVVASRSRVSGAVTRSARSVAREMRALRDGAGLVDISACGPGLLEDPSWLGTLAAELGSDGAPCEWDVSADPVALAKGAGDGREAERMVGALRAARAAGCVRVRVVLDEADAAGAADGISAPTVLAASRTLARAFMPGHLTVRYGSAGHEASAMRRLRGLIRAFRPRAGDLELAGAPPGDATPAAWLFEDERDFVPAATPRDAEMAEAALGQALTETCRGARPAPRDLAAAEAAEPGTAWLHVEWGDYWQRVGDKGEARGRYERAAQADPRSPIPWLRLAALAARDETAAARRQEEAALRQVLESVPRHARSLARLEELRQRPRAAAAVRPTRGPRRRRVPSP